jgi:nuclear transport factor 2 (NTF2) superfamily protein
VSDSSASTESPTSLGAYNDAWNERDVGKIAGHLTDAVTDDVVFADPANRIRGREALIGLITEARHAMPTAEYRLASAIDGGHDRRYRYHWDVVIDGATVFVGTDMTTLDERDRIERIDGFFQDLPRTSE